MPAKKLKFLITAGGTREYIDPVRFISNASSGKMGFALAEAAIKAGHNVTLITAATNLVPPKPAKVIPVETARQMFTAVKDNFNNCDCLIMAAAVSDYTPVKPYSSKIKKTNRVITIKLKPTVDILRWAGKHKNPNQIVVGFALEDKNLLTSAAEKLHQKNADLIIANSTKTIGAEKAQVYYRTRNGKWVKLPQASKRLVAGRIFKAIQTIRKA